MLASKINFGHPLDLEESLATYSIIFAWRLPQKEKPGGLQSMGSQRVGHGESDILECEVKWALGSITMNKASGSDGIPVELFQILKDDAVEVLHSICQQSCSVGRKNSAMLSSSLLNPRLRQVFKTVLKSGLHKTRR